MLRFTATIGYYSANKDKTGWSFILLTKSQTHKLNPGVRQAFRVKGQLDDHPIKQKSLLPVSGDRFMMPIDAKIRRAIGKKAGDTIKVQLELDSAPLKISGDLLTCLKDEPGAHTFFKSLAPSHQRYFSNFIEEAKTDSTKAKRIAMSLMALARKMDFGMMIRENHAERKGRG